LIETSPTINQWVKIGVYLKLTQEQIKAFRIEKNATLYDENGKIMGKTIRPLDISMLEENIGYVEAYTHQDNLNMTYHPELELMKQLNSGNYLKKDMEPYMKKFGFTAYKEDNILKYNQYFIYESTVVDFSPLDRITLLFNQNQLIGFYHTRNITAKGFKTHALVRGHKFSVMETISNQEINNLIQKRNAYYNAVD
jgi:hypothetical protein